MIFNSSCVFFAPAGRKRHTIKIKYHAAAGFPMDRRVWYTDTVLRAVQQLIRRLINRTPYPLALQSLISLVLLATLPSALAENGYVLSARFGLLCVVVGLALAVCWLIPVRKFSAWLQLAYLCL